VIGSIRNPSAIAVNAITLCGMGARETLRLLLAAATAAALLIAAPGVSAGRGRVLQVYPGQLKAKLAAARDGDTLLVHRGHYRSTFVITKSVRIVGAKGEPRPLIDAGCKARAAILVIHSGVVLRRLSVTGADESHGSFPSEVDFSGVRSGRAVELRVHDTCDAEYGINVFGSRQIDVVDNRASGFSDSAIYVGGISTTGGGVLRVNRNEAFGSNRGIIVENSAGGDLRFKDNEIHDNRSAGEGEPSGIFVHNSDGVLFSGNRVRNNGRYGVHIDANSDSNRFFGNTVSGNPDGNIFDQGSGNCGSGNHPNPFPACP
jgi:parallel beta-helix repeat protein